MLANKPATIAPTYTEKAKQNIETVRQAREYRSRARKDIANQCEDYSLRSEPESGELNRLGLVAKELDKLNPRLTVVGVPDRVMDEGIEKEMNKDPGLEDEDPSAIEAKYKYDSGVHLHRIGKTMSPDCMRCNVEDTPKHRLLNCPAYDDIRAEIKALKMRDGHGTREIIGRLDPNMEVLRRMALHRSTS
ncbi:hypothetical protein JTB14_005783 [Gonioctena quinquepunctata]|nr:hypothetical protein JTB14_005783 [Gonioctena quinquepunctata]